MPTKRAGCRKPWSERHHVTRDAAEMNNDTGQRPEGRKRTQVAMPIDVIGLQAFVAHLVDLGLPLARDLVLAHAAQQNAAQLRVQWPKPPVRTDETRDL